MAPKDILLLCYLFSLDLYTLQLLYTASLVGQEIIFKRVQHVYILDLGLAKGEKMIYVKWHPMLLFCYLLSLDLYTLQFLHTASLVSEDWQEIIAMGAQHVYL